MSLTPAETFPAFSADCETLSAQGFMKLFSPPHRPNKPGLSSFLKSWQDRDTELFFMKGSGINALTRSFWERQKTPLSLPRWQHSPLSDSRQDLQGRDADWHVGQECFLLPFWTSGAPSSSPESEASERNKTWSLRILTCPFVSF